jgi:hypothetical protein
MKKLFALDPQFLRQISEISLRFVSPVTLLNVITVAGIVFIAGLIDQLLLIHLSGPFRAAWWVLIQALLVGRYTLAASEGSFHSDIFDSFSHEKLPGFMLRYILISLVWIIPLGILVFGFIPVQQLRLTGVTEWLISEVFLTGSMPFSPNFTFWLTLLGISLGGIFPVYSAILAGISRSPAQVLQPSLWKHPFQNGAPPVLVLIAMLGSLATVFLLYLPWVGGIALLAFQASRTLGGIIASLAILFPLMSWPIIAGRLAGTWAFFHPLPVEDELFTAKADLQEAKPSMLRPTLIVPTLSPAPPVPPQEDLGTLLLPVYSDLDTNPTQAFGVLLGLKKRFPDDARVLGLELRLLLKFGHRPKAMSLAMVAVQALVKSPYGAEIVPIFQALGKDRHTLPWDSTMLDLLAKVFMDAKDFKEAGWCAHTSELQMGNSARAGKRLVQIADAASAGKYFESSVGLLKYYMKNHPDGPFVEYARKAAEFNQKQIGADSARK